MLSYINDLILMEGFRKLANLVANTQVARKNFVGRATLLQKAAHIFGSIITFLQVYSSCLALKYLVYNNILLGSIGFNINVTVQDLLLNTWISAVQAL
jgi:hypothetical protein